jgi:hypothetical protein
MIGDHQGILDSPEGWSSEIWDERRTYYRSVQSLQSREITLLQIRLISTEGSGQGRIQGRRQPAPGHPLGSLKNKGHMVKNKISFDSNILFIWTGHPYRSFLAPPLNTSYYLPNIEWWFRLMVFWMLLQFTPYTQILWRLADNCDCSLLNYFSKRKWLYENRKAPFMSDSSWLWVLPSNNFLNYYYYYLHGFSFWNFILL